VSFGTTLQRRDPIRVFVVSPHRLLGEALSALMAALPGIEPIGQVEDAAALMASSLRKAPDLVLLACPQPVALKELSTLARACPQARVLYLAPIWTADQALAVLQAGAVGCLSMNIAPDELAVALRQAARGETTLSPDLARDLIARLAQEQPPSPGPYDRLTPREQEVLKLVCYGLSNKEIAQHLYLSVRTIENHLASIYRKLGVRSRTEAAVLAVQRGWVNNELRAILLEHRKKSPFV